MCLCAFESVAKQCASYSWILARATYWPSYKIVWKINGILTSFSAISPIHFRIYTYVKQKFNLFGLNEYVRDEFYTHKEVFFCIQFFKKVKLFFEWWKFFGLKFKVNSARENIVLRFKDASFNNATWLVQCMCVYGSCSLKTMSGILIIMTENSFPLSF